MNDPSAFNHQGLFSLPQCKDTGMKSEIKYTCILNMELFRGVVYDDRSEIFSITFTV